MAGPHQPPLAFASYGGPPSSTGLSGRNVTRPGEGGRTRHTQMRLLLVGTPHERERLRAEMDHASFTIAGEFETLADARASGIEANGILIADLTLRQAQGHPEFRRGLKGPRRTNDFGRPFTGRLDDDIDEPLTPREIDVLEQLAEGLSNKAIAARLGISDQTVKFHVASICGKLGAANRTDAVRRAVRRGLISL